MRKTLAALILTISSPAYALENQGFEWGVAAWDAFNATATAANGSNSGNLAVELVGPSSSIAQASKNPLVGDPLDAGLWVKLVSGTGHLAVSIREGIESKLKFIIEHNGDVTETDFTTGRVRTYNVDLSGFVPVFSAYNYTNSAPMFLNISIAVTGQSTWAIDDVLLESID